MAFLENIEVNWFSMVPVILILVSFLQAMIFRSYSSGEDDLTTNNTAYSFIETDEKAYRSGMKWHSICKLVVILPLFLLVIYFPSLHKVILSILLYGLSYILNLWLSGSKGKKRINSFNLLLLKK